MQTLLCKPYSASFLHPSSTQDGLVTADDSQEIRDVFPSVGKAPRFTSTLLLVAQIDHAPGLEGAQ